MKGDIVIAPSGEEVVLADIGLIELHDGPTVRVWDVTLEPGECHPWHLHHNPYVVLSMEGSDGRMDWLDGAQPRFISEYSGGAVYRPVSPVHRLTNIGEVRYRNRLIEFKDLGERLAAPVDIGTGGRSALGRQSTDRLQDGRELVLAHPHVSVWTVTAEPGAAVRLDLDATPHVLAAIEAEDAVTDPTGGVTYHPGGPVTITNTGAHPKTWFAVRLSYLDDLRALTGAGTYPTDTPNLEETR